MLAISAVTVLAVEETTAPPEPAAGTGNLMLLLGIVAIGGIAAFMMRRGSGEES